MSGVALSPGQGVAFMRGFTVVRKFLAGLIVSY